MGGPSHLPPGGGGAGDSTWTDWYEMYMRKTQGRISEPPGHPYPIGPAEVRREAVGQIYDRVDGKEPPSHNITSKALRAYYTRVDPQTLSTWACQILCMIAEYHMACMTRGSLVTSPIVLRGLEECLPPLADYASLGSCISTFGKCKKFNPANELGNFLDFYFLITFAL